MQNARENEDESLDNALLVAELKTRSAELERANEALRRSDAQKTAVMEAALDGIVLMDHEGRIIDFNDAAERTFGYSRAEAVGQLLAEIMIPEASRGAHTAGLARYLETGETRVLGRRLEVSALRRGGILFEAEIAIVRIAADGPAVFTGYIRDITERRRAAEAEILRREKDAAEDANRELEAFSYSVAHDLRTPLRGINGFSTALLEDHGHVLDDSAKELINRVTASTRRMADLIDALLALASLSRVAIDWQTVDLAALARSIVEQQQAVEPHRRVTFIAPDRLDAIGDPRLLRALLENVVGNAWKFTRDRSDARIELFATDREGARYVHVRDNGVGFDMAYAAKLFVPFQRLHARSEFDGSGVGLATVQRIVRRHGGEVTAEGHVDGGATISFTLPPQPPRPAS